MRQFELFKLGDNGYHTYRIPSLLVTREGTVLAFCEARKNGAGDAGDIDVVLRRSTDHGLTWDAVRVIADEGSHTIGNPCAVQDRETGTIWLILCRNAGDGPEKDILAGRAPRDVLVMKSDDDGVTWSGLRDITREVKRPDWTWYATGPCHAIQLSSGRLLVPCNHAVLNPDEEASGPYTAHVIYSDDHGESWHIGGIVGPYTNECAVAELADGTVYINMRSYHGQNRRAVSRSHDGGMTWSPIELDEALVEPVCQGSLISDGEGNLWFANPSSTTRERLTVWKSMDNGITWSEYLVLHEGPSAYSDLAVSADDTLLCLYESGDEGCYERIMLAIFK